MVKASQALPMIKHMNIKHNSEAVSQTTGA